MFDQAYYQGALQRFQQSVQSDPKNPDGYYNLARTYHQLGKLHNQATDFQQAESYYHQCLDRDPNNQDCYRGLAVRWAHYTFMYVGMAYLAKAIAPLSLPWNSNLTP